MVLKHNIIFSIPKSFCLCGRHSFHILQFEYTIPLVQKWQRSRKGYVDQYILVACRYIGPTLTCVKGVVRE